MDRKETELRAGESPDRGGSAGPGSAKVDLAEPPGSRFEELLRQAEALHRSGRHEHAIHLWTRVLFLDRGNREARGGIDRAKQALAERERRLDAHVAEARRLFEEGEVEAAREELRAALALDPRHPEASALDSEITAATRREISPAVVEPAGSSAVPESVPHSKGFVLRVPRSRGRAHEERRRGSRAQIGLFVLSVALVFGTGAFLLRANWERLVNDDAFARHASLAPPPVPDPGDVEVPDLAELHYYNGARLFALGRYREALAELSRIERDAPVAGEARRLILRIEERLLRGVSSPAPGRDESAGGRDGGEP